MIDPSTAIRIQKVIEGPVGFSQLPVQIQREIQKTNFEFTVMTVGESGLGKSTLLNSLFFTDLYDTTDYPAPEQRLTKTTAVQSSTIDLVENDVKLALTVVDTPGFGDRLDNGELIETLVEYIDAQYENYRKMKSRATLAPFKDTRVHACLYFISPSTHGLKAIDIAFLQALHKKVNIIPIIAKADTFTTTELTNVKSLILADLRTNGIRVFDFILDDDATPQEVKEANHILNLMPLSVIGCNTVVAVEGRMVKGRQCPWGLIDIENDVNSDFNALRNLLVRNHMRDLYDYTHEVLYENFCQEKCASNGVSDPCNGFTGDFTDQMNEHERHLRKIKGDLDCMLEAKLMDKMEDLQLVEER
eukprot:Ihof_evm3s416 gene=Ihof_evmTU3s416